MCYLCNTQTYQVLQNKRDTFHCYFRVSVPPQEQKSENNGISKSVTAPDGPYGLQQGPSGFFHSVSHFIGQNSAACCTVFPSFLLYSATETPNRTSGADVNLVLQEQLCIFLWNLRDFQSTIEAHFHITALCMYIISVKDRI